MHNFLLESTSGSARAGILKTQRGDIQTPVFMPPATRGAIKASLTPEDLTQTQTQICLGNTYHLYLRPGSEIIKQSGGLHKFMKWDKPILTDSGGFQVFSIRSKKISDEGVHFRSHIDGDEFFLNAQKSIEIQHDLGSDIIMAWDECPPNVPNWHKIKKAVDRTTQWAKESLEYHFSIYDQTLSPETRPQIFGIIQGGCYPDLREQSLEEITNLPFDGYALGGLAVGETNTEMYKVVERMTPKMPEDRPRYLMGVGTPLDLLECIERGIDMFDCVLPMRNARHGKVYTWNGVINIKNAQYREDLSVLDASIPDYVNQEKQFTRAYLHHLFRVGEDLGRRLLTMHNIAFYQDLMRQAREHIQAGDFGEWKAKILKQLV